MALRLHSGRRSAVDPASLVPPDSSLARDAEVAAQDLTPVLLNHSRRSYAWGAAIAALDGITFDGELLCVDSGAEAYLLSAGRVIQEYPRLGFKREFAGLLRAEAKQVPRERREHPARAFRG